MTGDGHAGMPPLMVLKPGRTCVLSIRNADRLVASDALHGHSFRVLSATARRSRIGSGPTRC